MVMMPPKTAQSPRAIKTLHRSRISLATSRFVVLFTVPERIPTVTPSLGGCFKSVMGVEVSSIFSRSWTSLSSVSSTDISHPAHAASQSIATLTLLMGFPPNRDSFLYNALLQTGCQLSQYLILGNEPL